MRHVVRIGPLLLAGSLVLVPAAGSEVRMQQQSIAATAVDGVSVSVTPVPRAPGDAVLAFRFVLASHDQDLGDDLAGSVTLMTDDGRELRPMRWSGTPPGGHHREGVLEFAVSPPVPSAVTLRMQRPGERAPRFFRFFF